jgi:glycosyltransferase involved in cell wall biosynthesis
MITVGITTYNRSLYLEKMARSLQESHGINECHIRVYDDHSKNIDETYLKTVFPKAHQITVRLKNLGADENIYQMYKDFLATDDQIFVNADSDLIFHPDWVEMVKKLLPKTDGILSLFNSNMLPPTKTLKIEGVELIEKDFIGSAGTVFTRDVVEKIVNEMKIQSLKRLDWKWSEYLRTQSKKRLLVVRLSLIQHIGIEGQNCNGIDQVNFGLGFIPVSDGNQRALVDFFEEITLSKLSETEKVINFVKSSRDYKLGSSVLKLPRFVKHLISKHNR